MVASVSVTTPVTRDDGPWTEEEKAACLAVREKLIKEKNLSPKQVGEIELVTIVMNSKCRVDEAVQKFMTYHENLLGEYGLGDVWSDKETLHNQWHRLAVCGCDEGGRSVMWVHGGGTPVEEEAACMRSCCWYFFAVHADRHTLRNGISLVINSANRPKKQIGNEKKLQVAWQNFPTRAQGIYILGTNMVTRVVVNALIAFASLFAKNKVIARIMFAEVKDLEKKWGGVESLPEMHGGAKRLPTAEWVDERLSNFPRMNLPEYVDIEGVTAAAAAVKI